MLRLPSCIDWCYVFGHELALHAFMRMWLGTFVLASALVSCGCMAAMRNQLSYRVTRQASTIPDIYYREVLNNLAMIETDASRMPYFSDPQTSRTAIQQTASSSYGLFFDLISTAPTGVLTLFNHYLPDRQSATLTATQRNSGEWAALTANDPDKLFTMRAAYHRVTGVSNAEDEEILAEFYYRHFEITTIPWPGSVQRIQMSSKPLGKSCPN